MCVGVITLNMSYNEVCNERGRIYALSVLAAAMTGCGALKKLCKGYR